MKDISKLGNIFETVKSRNPWVIVKGVEKKVENEDFTFEGLRECILEQKK